MTNWLLSTSLQNTSCPESGHLIHKFSGVSRRRILRIFGRTTLVSQFIFRSEWRSSGNRLQIYGGWGGTRQAAVRPLYLHRNCGLFRTLFRSPHALRQRGHEIGHRTDGFGRRAALSIEASAQGIDQRGADHRAVGILCDGARGFRRSDAEADTNRQFGMPLDAGDGLADLSGIGAGAAGDASDGDVVDKA